MQLTISFNDVILKLEKYRLTILEEKGSDFMPKKRLDSLTEPMYYTLIALLHPRCGIEITQFVMQITKNRVNLGPGTLYTMLSKFLEEDMINEKEAEGRKRIYQINAKGTTMLKEEFERLHTMIEEGKTYLEGATYEEEN